MSSKKGFNVGSQGKSWEKTFAKLWRKRYGQGTDLMNRSLEEVILNLNKAAKSYI